MSAIIKRFASPQAYIVGQSANMCAYCGIGDISGNFYVGPLDCILACKTHGDLAKRDGRAWFHKNNLVSHWDAFNDPLFTALNPKPGLVQAADLRIVTPSGHIESGWRFRFLASWNDPLHLYKEGDAWMIHVEEAPRGKRCVIHVSDLALSLPPDKHDFVDAFIARLERGFYKTEADASAAAAPV
jgi:hypothetical protein